MAVLAGYGKGKTSLAKKLVYDLAVAAVKDPLSRIPVYVPLADIANEQSLEGLLGKILTTNGLVSGYSYPLFRLLNEAGKFVIVLDGFDEMKHSITFEQFSYNFQELNRLVVGKSKIVVLGRPSAFLSEDEQNLVFKGESKVGDQILRTPGAPVYKEIEIADLALERAYSVVGRYASYYRKRDNQSIEDIDQRMNALRSYGIDDIVTRPVHAKMIASLVSDSKVTIRKFTAYDIFDLFIKQTIEREVLEKPVRKAFGIKDRRRFARRVAWTVWRTSNKQHIETKKIPDNVFKGIIPFGSPDPEAEKRDLIQACFLERKGSALYFPHRSFQEFLVAEFLLNEDFEVTDIRYICENINREILLFFSGNPERQKIMLKDRVVSDYTGTIPHELFREFALARNLRDALIGTDSTRGPHHSPWTVMLNTLNFLKSDQREIELSEYLEYLVNRANGSSDSFIRLSALFSFTLLTGLRDENQRYESVVWLAACIFEKVSFAKYFNKILEARRENRKYTGHQTNGRDSIEEQIVSKCFTFEHGSNDCQIEVQIFSSQLFIIPYLEQRYKVSNLDLQRIAPKITVLSSDVAKRLKSLDPKLLPAFNEFLNLKAPKI
jgi:hypothetical protein